MNKIKIIILLLLTTLFSFKQATTELELKTDNGINESNLVEVEEVEETPIIEEYIEEKKDTKTDNTSLNVKFNNNVISKTQKKTSREIKREESKDTKSKDNTKLTNETENKKEKTKVDPPKQEESKQEEKPKETKVTCDDFYESIHKSRTDVKTKSACISYGEKIVFNELDEVIEYNKVHDNTKDINIKSFTCYEVLDDNCNTKGWYLHFKCNTLNCDDSKIKKMYG